MNAQQANGINANGPERKRRDPRLSVVRLFSFGVAGVLSLLMLTSVMPSLTADRSDRAVVNAPLTLLTSPIAGEIRSLAATPGAAVTAGGTIAQIVNSRVDRSTLITLEGKLTETRESFVATKGKKEADLEYVRLLDAEIARQSQQLMLHFEQQISELKARVGSAEAVAEEREGVLGQQSKLVERKVASAPSADAAEQQYTAALHDTDAESARLNQKIAQFEGLKRGIFVGEDLVGLAALAQKRRDVQFDAERLGIEEIEASAGVVITQQLLDAEQKRLDSLAKAVVSAPTDGQILNVGAAAGRHVTAGDTLATLVNCDSVFVVAIFSSRQGQNLAVGSKVKIESASWSEWRPGTVREILPKTTDKVDEQFAVPFPPTERRELYVLVSLEETAQQRLEAFDGAREQSCPVGQWVTVTREDGWMPSTEVVWRKAATIISAAIDSVLSSARAEPSLARSSAAQPALDLTATDRHAADLRR